MSNNTSNMTSASPVKKDIVIQSKSLTPKEVETAQCVTDGTSKTLSRTRKRPLEDTVSAPPQATTISATTDSFDLNTTTLYVGNLHPRITQAHLEKLFQPFGEIIRIFFPTGRSSALRTRKGNYAFVEFKDASYAKRAMDKIHGRKLLERQLIVRPANERGNLGFRSIGSLVKGASGSTGKHHSSLQAVKRQKNEVETKIEAVKRAIEENKRKLAK